MVGQEDLERISSDYTDEDGNLTVDDVREDLEQAGFDDFDSFGDITEQVSGFNDAVVSDEVLRQAQSQAAQSVDKGGAVADALVRGEGGKTIGAPKNVDQRIERTGPESGDVIGRNVNTGTEGKIGSVDLAPEPDGGS